MRLVFWLLFLTVFQLAFVPLVKAQGIVKIIKENTNQKIDEKNFEPTDNKKLFVASEPIPLSGLTLRMQSKGSATSDFGGRVVKIVTDKDKIMITWTVLEYLLHETVPYYHYKLAARRGSIELDSVNQKSSFYFPALWQKGYVVLSDSNPLWISPHYLDLQGKEVQKFSLGFLDREHLKTEKGGDELFEKINYVQNIIDYVESEGQSGTVVGLKAAQQKEIKKFIQTFSHISKIARTKADLRVNGVKTAYPCVILGNSYYQMVVLENKNNPLVISFKIFPQKVPQIFENAFAFFKNYFEYSIISIQYEEKADAPESNQQSVK